MNDSELRNSVHQHGLRVENIFSKSTSITNTVGVWTETVRLDHKMVSGKVRGREKKQIRSNAGELKGGM